MLQARFHTLALALQNSPKPDLCASAGNTDANYRQLQASGVWGFSALGNATEGWRTSYLQQLHTEEGSSKQFALCVNLAAQACERKLYTNNRCPQILGLADIQLEKPVQSVSVRVP